MILPQGLLPAQAIRAFVVEGAIAAVAPIGEAEIQPASLDLRLGSFAWRVRASFLPGRGRRVEEKIETLGMHRIDLTQGAVLERGCVYVAPLQERLRLPADVEGVANPKSSSGRLDVFTRLIGDGAGEFDRVPAGYEGALYAEIAPRTFSVLAREGDRLNQLRFRRGPSVRSDAELDRLQGQVRLVHGEGAADIAGGIAVTIDLEGPGGGGEIIGFRARKHAGLIDLRRIAYYDPLEYWEPIRRRADRRLILDPDDFYIMASREAVTVPPDHAAEMFPYNPLVGEFRVHYAGFFDPGFGWEETGGAGSRAVLEIRSHEVPFAMEHGQTVARLVYERLAAAPDKLYGAGIGSNYQAQGLKLSKQFKPL